MLFEMPQCGGCRTCELACGFKHTGAFSYSASSLRVIERPDSRGYTLSLEENAEGSHLACDGCRDLDTPLCVQYCREADELRKMVDEFIQKATPTPGAHAARPAP